MPSLYLVATPIGNLEDVTLRALRVLGEVGLIAAEDTRITRRLLQRYDIRTPLVSYHEHNKRTRLPSLLAALADRDVALVSDAGTPGISDPGCDLVSAAAEVGIEVIPIPGPSALTAALAISGLASDQFVYLGFLPRRRADRRRLLDSLARETRALVAFEAPHRLRACLEDALNTLGDRRIAVCRELTKIHEEVFRGWVSEALAHFAAPRGEFVLVMAGGTDAPDTGKEIEARELLVRLRQEGAGVKEAMERVRKLSGLPRSALYRMWLDAKDGPTARENRG